MRTRRWFCLAVLLLGLTAAVQADNYPFDGKAFIKDGVIEKVDADRDRVIFKGDDDQHYTLDTKDSEITLLDGSRAGMTPDLSPGMRVHVSGTLLSANIAEVSQLRVLDNSPLPRPKLPAGPQSLPLLPSGPDDPNAITLRGTVDTVDPKQGTFVVLMKDPTHRVKDHTREILLADDTDLSGLEKMDPQAFPVRIGDRVTVAGALQPDGTVLAGAISYSRDLAFPVPPTRLRETVLLGRVSAQSDRLSSRDIKIRLADDREVKVKVPRGIPIRRDGQPTSVHDLRGGDAVRITGSYDGSDFKATRIEVLHAGQDASPGGFSRL